MGLRSTALPAHQDREGLPGPRRSRTLRRLFELRPAQVIYVTPVNGLAVKLCGREQESHRADGGDLSYVRLISKGPARFWDF